jgi:hypothetical protein
MKSNLTKTLSFSLIVLSTGVILFSCQKDKKEEPADNTDAIQLSIAHNTSETLYDDVFDVVLQDGQSNNVAGKGESCATVTLNNTEPNTFPKIMTIDFGTGCTSNNGITRKGKLIATLSGKIRTAGTVVSVAFENYYVNGYKLEGSFSITNNSGNSGLGFTTQTTNGKLIYPDGTTWFTHSGTHTLTQTAGAGTITFTDDDFSLTGNGTTASSAGNSLSTNITTALIKKATCINIVSGVQAFTYNSISGSLNYGDGNCDKLATLTVGPYNQTVTLPR